MADTWRYEHTLLHGNIRFGMMRAYFGGLLNTGERKDFEVYSCDVSPDGKRLVTAAGGQ